MRRAISSLFAAALLALMPGTALAAPGIPMALHGNTFGTTGLVIKAWMNGTVVASTTVRAGAYGYASALFFIPDPARTRAGATLSFTVGGVRAAQSLPFAGGAITELNLTPAGKGLSLAAVAFIRTLIYSASIPLSRAFDFHR